MRDGTQKARRARGDWLGQILAPAERARLHELVADRAPASVEPASSVRPAIGLPANHAAPGSTRAARRA